MKEIEVISLAKNQTIIFNRLNGKYYFISYESVIMMYNVNSGVMSVDRNFGFYSRTTTKYMIMFLDYLGIIVSLKELRERLNDISNYDYIWSDLN